MSRLLALGLVASWLACMTLGWACALTALDLSGNRGRVFYECGYVISVHHPRRPSYYIAFYRQPRWRRLIAAIYHAYDSTVPRIPGFQWLERWHQRHYERDLTYVPLTCRQDIRCYFLHTKGRVQLAQLYIPAEAYRALGHSTRTEGGDKNAVLSPHPPRKYLRVTFGSKTRRPAPPVPVVRRGGGARFV